ncbi:MAG: hypothetical protein K2I49_03070 [Ureaplasma sp.]|nr:hypothetical protein [Ureaplasma sp.]
MSEKSKLGIINGFGFGEIFGVLLMFVFFYNMHTKGHQYYVYIGIVIAILVFILNLAASLVILCSKWTIKWSNEKKKVLGTLSIFLIFFIGLTIFGITTYNKLNNRRRNSFSNIKEKTKQHDLNDFIEDY